MPYVTGQAGTNAFPVVQSSWPRYDPPVVCGVFDDYRTYQASRSSA